MAQADKNTPAKTAPVISERNFSAACSGKDIAAGRIGASRAPTDLGLPRPSPD
jgi:hypothetical protein